MRFVQFPVDINRSFSSYVWQCNVLSVISSALGQSERKRLVKCSHHTVECLKFSPVISVFHASGFVRYTQPIEVTFWCVWKAVAKNDRFLHVHFLVCLSACNSTTYNGQIFMEFGICDLPKFLSYAFRFWLKSDKANR
jgi:hypothetical protein